MMSVAELIRIDRSIEIKAPPERVWRALTDKSELSAWFQVKFDGEVAAGNEVQMESLHPGCQGTFRVQFVEMTPPLRFVWKWHPGAVDPKVDYSKEPRTTVTFTLDRTATGTRLSVAETGFTEISLERRAKVFSDNEQGWAEVLGWVQKHVETAG